MSSRYPGDTDDALFMTDGTPEWYMSPDVWLTTPVANLGQNDIHLRVHLQEKKSFEASQAEIEVFVGNPSLVMSPTSGTKNLGTVLVARSALTSSPTRSVETTLSWVVPAIDPADPHGPNQPGHRCLVARVYPFGSSKPFDFQVVADQHEAQRNLCIIDCRDNGPIGGGAGGGMVGAPGTPMGKGEDGLWAFAVDTTTLGQERTQVAIRATVVDTFTPAELEQVLPLLEPAGFKRLAASPPPTTKLEFVTAEQVVDPGPPTYPPVCALLRKILPIPPLWKLVDKFCAPTRPPGARVKVELQPGRTARVALKVDLAETAVHEAQALRLEQVGATGDVEGGVLLVFHRVA